MATPKPMKVRATARGYYGRQLREPGAVFTLRDGEHDFSENWMEEYVAPPKNGPKTVRAAAD